MTILEAVKAVPHRDRCGVDYVGEGLSEYVVAGKCDCDRDKRIAKGIEAAMQAVASWRAGVSSYDAEDETEYAVAEFVKASAL
jgi:hypothetical protein